VLAPRTSCDALIGILASDVVALVGRLVDLVASERTQPAADIVKSVLKAVDLFSQGGTHDDDRVIFVMRVV